MRAFVTGAGGFVGRNLVHRLLEEGDDVIAVVRDVNSPLYKLAPQIQVICHDLRNRFRIAAPVDVVFSLAASADPRRALENPSEALANSVSVMANTLAYAESVGARVIHVSTNEVGAFEVDDEIDNGPVAFCPRGPYAVGKTCQEVICRESSVDVTTVVAQSLFGEHQQFDKFIPTALRSLAFGDPVRVQCNRYGNPSGRPWFYVGDLVDALVSIARRTSYSRRRFCVGAEASISNLFVARVLAEALEQDPVVALTDIGDRAGHELISIPIRCDVPHNIWMPPMVSVEERLSHVAHWYKGSWQTA
jgi:nucleoside-diphosphate-sugar epimerase